MDTIFIENLILWGRHGLLPHEKIRTQPFTINIQLNLDLSSAGASDKLTDSLDYAKVKDIIQTVIEGKRANLMEHLGERICTELLKNPQVRNVCITLRKPSIWPEGIPGITLERNRL